MKLLKFAFRRETAAPISAVIFASAVSVGLVLARMAWTRNIDDYAFLIWNLFLACLPLVFALLACRTFCSTPRAAWPLAAWTGTWLLFFPNAPYILTDIIHLTKRFHGQFWVDLILVLSCALTGLVLGFLSLFLMQGVVARLYGKLAGWTFVAVAAGLSGCGIYVGRFLRFNSWDVVVSPFELLRGVGNWATHPKAYAFPVLFGVFMFIAYLMLYALTHLNPLPPTAMAPESKAA